MRKLRSLLKIALCITGGLLTVLILAAAALTLRLAYGPVETSVPQSLLDRVVAEAAPGWRVEAGGAQLDFSSNDGLNGLKLHDVILSDTAGNQVVRAPVLGLRFALTASMDPSSALTIREVALTGASVDVTRDADGGFQMAFSDLAGSGGAGDRPTSLDGLGDLSALPQLRIEDAHIRYTDLARGTTWQTERARLTLTPSDEGLSGSLAMVIDGGIGGAQLDAFHRTEDGDVSATLILNGVRPSRVAELDPILAPLARIDAPLNGKIEVSADDSGSFHRISAHVAAAAGTVRLTNEPTELTSFSSIFVCETKTERCDINELSIETAEFSAKANGFLRQSAPDKAALKLNLTRVAGQQGDVLASISDASIEATINTVNGEISVDRALAGGLSLGGLEDGTTIRMGRIGAVGNFEPSSQVLTLPRFEAQSFAMTDSSGQNQTLARLAGSVRYDMAAGQVSFSQVEASEATLGNSELAVRIAKASGAARFDIPAQRIDVSPFTFSDLRVKPKASPESQIGRLTIDGSVDLATQSLRDGTVQIRSAALALPELYREPLRIGDAKLSLSAAHLEGVTRVTLKSAVAEVAGLTAKAKGNFALRASGTALGKVEASIGPVRLEDLPKHWPRSVAPGGLSWVRDNVKTGLADGLTLTAQFDEAKPERDTLDLRFGFRDARVTFAPGMPPIQRASGQGKVTLDRFDISLSGGAVDVPGASALSLTGTSFAIADFSPEIPAGQVKLRAAGAVGSVLRLLDAEPLGVISPTGFDIATANGHADVRVLLDLPLADDLRIDDVQFDARAKIHEYSLKEPETGMPVSGDLLLVKATGDGLSLQSDARIGGLAARLGYALDFEPPKNGEPDSILTLESFLSLQDFARHGLVLDDHLEGLTAMKARIEMFEGGAARINADADLTNLRLKLDQVGWSKAAGVPATIRMSGFRNPDGAGRIQALTLRGEGLSADGSIGFGADGQISRANFTRIILGSAVDTGVVYGRKTNGDVGILLKGAQLDLRHAFTKALEGESEAEKPAKKGAAVTDLSMQVGRVFLRDDLGVFDLKGGVRLQGDGLHAANLSGKLNGSAPAKLLAERRSEGLALRLSSNDAGAFIRATDIFQGAYDGTLLLDAVRRDTVSPAQISGRILVSDMVVHDAPTLGRILKGGAIGTLLGDLADGGISFEKVELPFSGSGSRWQINDGVAYGPQLGLTLDGGYDIAQNLLALNGSISPAYAINGALGNVPLLGSLLTGGEGEGVFGVTFSVNGDSKKPEVNVNPLSALAPGFLRKIVAEVGKSGSKAPRRQDNSRIEK